MGSWPNLLKFFVSKIGLPVVAVYHVIISSVFLNVAAVDANWLERAGNELLAPSQYLFVGKVALPQTDGTYLIEQRFSYDDQFMQKSVGAAIILPVSWVVGASLKSLAYLDPKARARHHEIVHAYHYAKTKHNLVHYRSLGMKVGKKPKKVQLTGPHFQRRPGDEKNLSVEKQALAQIASILTAEGIPFWIDRGTCLGAMRYQGVVPWDYDIDIGVIANDFQNVYCALKKLDPKKYQVQDWSSRRQDAPFLKVYVKESGALIDIFHYRINKADKTLQVIVANNDSLFLSDGWRAYEARYEKPIPFSTIFPLKVAEFDGLWLPVPHKTKEFLTTFYGDIDRPVRYYSEETDAYEKDLEHPYWQEVNVY
ncbi:MAG: LicD family protein [Candidatus Algichlamydia australiensis]|nr:LicD family protein [Chlamydiales bacterium]